MLKGLGYTFGFISWMAVITLLSLFSFSGDDSPQIKIPHLDKAVHFTFYFIAALLGCLFLRERTKGNLKRNKTIVIMTVFVVIYGIIIEVIQSNFTEQRTGDFYDGLFNSIGAVTGAYIIYRLFSGKTQLKWKI